MEILGHWTNFTQGRALLVHRPECVCYETFLNALVVIFPAVLIRASSEGDLVRRRFWMCWRILWTPEGPTTALLATVVSCGGRTQLTYHVGTRTLSQVLSNDEV